MQDGLDIARDVRGGEAVSKEAQEKITGILDALAEMAAFIQSIAASIESQSQATEHSCWSGGTGRENPRKLYGDS